MIGTRWRMRNLRIRRPLRERYWRKSTAQFLFRVLILASHFIVMALRLLPALSSECSLSLAASLMLRFHHTSQLGDLDEAISLLAGLLPSTLVNIPPPGTLARTCVAYLTKSVVTGSEFYRERALAVHDLHQVCAMGSWGLPRLIELLPGLDKARD